MYQAIRLEEKGKVKTKADYKPDYKKGNANETNKQYGRGYATAKETDQKPGGVKSNNYNAQRNNKSLAQVVMKEDKANPSFRNNILNKSTAYKARKVEQEEEKEVSNEEVSSEGEQEDQECKSVMRVGVQSEEIK